MGNNKNLHGHLFALTANVMWGLMSPIGSGILDTFHLLQTGACGPPRYAEDFLCFPLCSGFQSGDIYLRAFDDFAY